MAAGALDPYQRRLFALLSLATFFEGFDTLVTTLVLHQLGEEFGASKPALFEMLALVGFGAFFGFVPLRLADRLGRKPLFVASVGGYTLLCLATAASRTLGEFALCQFFARMFMVTELALAYILLSEETPAERRGRLNGLMGAFASVGAIVPALLLPLSERLGFGWRGLYVAGGSLVVVLPLYLLWLREPAAFRALPARSRGAEWRELLSLFAPVHRRRAAAAALAWLAINFWSACAIFSFALYAQSERGWTPADLALWVPLGGGLQFAGYAIAGRAMDAFGRRPALIVVLGLASLASVLAYTAHAKPFVVAGYLSMVTLGGMWSIGQTITAELFPTQLRATANGLANNVVGRLGMIAGPAMVGALTARLGDTGGAVAWLGCANLLAIPALLVLLPETRGARLAAGVPSRDALHSASRSDAP